MSRGSGLTSVTARGGSAIRANVQTEFYDVFIIDSDFAIERPKRVYRTGLHWMTGKSTLRGLKNKSAIGSGDGLDENDVDLDNPFAQEMVIANGEANGQRIEASHDDSGDHHASQHTFFIVNTQRRLKLVAKNAVSCFGVEPRQG